MQQFLQFITWRLFTAQHVLLVVVGPAGRPDHDQQHRYHHAPKVKPQAAAAVVELLMMGVRTLETCWAVNKRQVINLKNCCM
jgi:hypothetical protein